MIFEIKFLRKLMFLNSYVKQMSIDWIFILL